ncbi:MAG TPA: glycosyltransferase family 4 protein [Desulfuromonadales bacterium]|nr:glycosyltransferase family 4 protein [Desulfuromonadales bacterium]
MRVLIVSQYFWPENFRINDLASGLAERGHEVTVLTGMPNYPEGKIFAGYGFWIRQEEYKGVKVIRVPLISRGNGRSLRLIANYMSFALSACLFGPILCRAKSDLIFVCQLSPVTVGLPALLLKKIKRIPIMFWILDLWPESLSATGAINSKSILKVVDNLVRYIYRGCDKILMSSQGFITSILAKASKSANPDYFPNWQEPEYSMAKIIPENLPEGFRIVFAGNIGSAQNFETIISVAEKLKGNLDIQWVILGDGRCLEWVKEQVELRNLSSSFHLKGRYPAEMMPSFFAQADIMLVTLKRDPAFALTVPGKIQSYMACGRPIVAALDGEGGRLIIESGAGLSVSSEDVDALADAIMTMYHMPKDEREAMGKNGKDYCEENFDRDKLLNRLEVWMQELIQENNNNYSAL